MNEHQRNAYIEAWLVEARPSLLSWLTTHSLCDVETAEDCVQVVLSKAPAEFRWRPIPPEKHKDKFLGFLRTCARNEAISRIRKREARTRHETTFGLSEYKAQTARQQTPLQQIIECESHGAGRVYLTTQVRRILLTVLTAGTVECNAMLARLEGHAPAEIAARLGHSYGSIRVALERARKKVRNSEVAEHIREALSE